MALAHFQETIGRVLADGDVFIGSGASVEVRDETSGALAAIFVDRDGVLSAIYSDIDGSNIKENPLMSWYEKILDTAKDVANTVAGGES